MIIYTPDFCWKGGVAGNTHMRTLNNTEWAGGGGRGSDMINFRICKIFGVVYNQTQWTMPTFHPMVREPPDRDDITDFIVQVCPKKLAQRPIPKRYISLN